MVPPEETNVNPSNTPTEIQAALDSLQSGGTVIFANGTYDLGSSTLVLPHNTRLQGSGETVLTNSTGFLMINADDSVGAELHSIALEFTGPQDNFVTAVRADSSVGFRAHNCSFTAEPGIINDTQHAILARAASDVLVTSCYAKHMQFKLAGPAGGIEVVGIKVRGCRFKGPYNYAVSVVSNNPLDSIRDVEISGCVVEDVPSAGVFTVGSDGGANDLVELSDVLIANNTVSGIWRTSGTPGAVLMHPAVTTTRVRIENNTIVNSGPAQASGPAIVFDSQVGGSASDINISGNTVIGDFNHEAIRCHPGVGAKVCGNRCPGGRGIGVTGAQEATIEGNIISSTSTGLDLTDVTDSTIKGNDVETTAAFKYAVKGTDIQGCEIADNSCSFVSAGRAWSFTNTTTTTATGNTPEWTN